MLLLSLLRNKPCALRHLPLLGLAVTSATVVIYGAPIVDPVMLIGKMQGMVPICTALFGELSWQVHLAHRCQRLLSRCRAKQHRGTLCFGLYSMRLACLATQIGG